MLWHVLDALQISKALRLEPSDDLLAPENIALRCSASVVQIMQVSYGSVPRPGAEIKGPFDYKKIPQQDCFAILRCNIKELDLLYLGDIHQRAVYKIGEPLVSVWVAP